MRKYIYIALLFLLCAGRASAQFTLVNGTVTDANSVAYACGTISASIVNLNGQSLYLNGVQFSPQPSATKLGCPTDPTTSRTPGAFTVQLADNAQLKCGSGASIITCATQTQWLFTVNTTGIPPPLGTGPQTCSATITITGSSQSITGNFSSCPVQSATATPISSVTPLFPAGTILAEYQMLNTDTCASLKDSSGNANNATGTVGTPPTILAGTGGCNFAGNGAITLPAALNSAQAVTLFLQYQSAGNGAQVHNFPFGGNGNGTLNHCNALDFTNAGRAVIDPLVNGSEIYVVANNVNIDVTLSIWNGTGVITTTFGTTQGGGADDDKLFINGVQPGYIATGSALRGNQNVGAYQLGGNAAGSCFSTQSFFTGKIFYAVFWGTEPTAAQEAAARNVIVNAMANRNINVSMKNTQLADFLVVIGDSISAGNGLTETAWHYGANNCATLCFVAPQPQLISNTAVTGFNLGTNIFPSYKQLLFPLTAAPVSTMQVWAGTNDGCASTALCQVLMDDQQIMCRDWKLNGGTRCLIATMLSRTGSDTVKDLYDPIIVNQWANFFDGLLDFAANANLGADGASASATYFQGDGVHPNQNSEYNIILPLWLHKVNQVAANQNFSSGNTYSTTTPAAVAVTAATESGNTMTFTTAANTFIIGQCATVSGVTPAGYNTPANQCWTILTAPNNTTFTAWNNTTGLGALTVAGTASTPQETDSDAFYSTLAQNAAGTHVLQPCEWHIGAPKFVRITSTVAWTITPRQSTETINGGATFTTPTASATNNPIVRLDAIRGTAAAAGCTWKASIQ